MPAPLKVGIIGASAEGGWARDSHVPAVRNLAGFELAAVATNSKRTADASARAFGVPAAYGSGMDLVHTPGIDVVAVTTRVPDHRALVLAALAAGKQVYCEWPLGCSVAEAEEMAAAARSAGVHVAIGLQLRASPVLRRARELLTSGAIGRILSVSTYAATAGFGPDVPAPFLYLEEPENFANLVTIQGAHAVDCAMALAGGLSDLTGLATAQYPEIRADGQRRPRTTFDHMVLHGRLLGGGTLAAEVAGGRPPETPFWLEAVGDKGMLRLGGGAPRGFQSGRLTMHLNGEPIHVDEGELAGMSDSAANVAGVYAALRDDIAAGTTTIAGFDHAARLTRLITDLLASSAEGARKYAADWPGAAP